MKNTKNLLFERMHTIGGMPLNERFLSKEDLAKYSQNEHEIEPEVISKAASEFPERDESPSYQVKLDNIARCSQELHDLIKDFDDLPTWVQDKITISEHNMKAIHDWIRTLGHEEDEHGQLVDEAKKMKGEDPCWDGYEMVGNKMKDGKEVPNCVPKD